MSMVMEVGAFEAKTHFSELIEAARGGKEIVVTRRGQAIARICPIEDGTAGLASLLSEFELIRSAALAGPSVAALRDEGRR